MRSSSCRRVGSYRYGNAARPVTWARTRTGRMVFTAQKNVNARIANVPVRSTIHAIMAGEAVVLIGFFRFLCPCNGSRTQRQMVCGEPATGVCLSPEGLGCVLCHSLPRAERLGPFGNPARLVRNAPCCAWRRRRPPAATTARLSGSTDT